MSGVKVVELLLRFSIPLFLLSIVFSTFLKVNAEDDAQSEETIVQQRMNYYFQYENSNVPWYYLAAVDQYERNIQEVRSDIPKRSNIISVRFSEEFWSGPLNPKVNDTSPVVIRLFEDAGHDGDGDGLASIENDKDILFTMVSFLGKYGSHEQDFRLALWDFYKNETIVNQIMTIAKLYKNFETIDLGRHTFPLALEFDYSYRGTWGANRGWGGRRTHEGTDLFANTGTPVLSTSYGVVEIMGWNEFGGWRIGIRNIHNSYHYYAHLSSFERNLKVGDIVEPGQVIGYVGSTGYGKEGTAGKFPPHLHYGIYKFDGLNERAFDPYPFLVKWERRAKSEREENFKVKNKTKYKESVDN